MNSFNGIVVSTNPNANKQNHGISICCFVLLLTYGSLWCLNGKNAYDHIKTENSTHYITNVNTHKSTNQFINISLNKPISHCNADPVYLISRWRSLGDMAPLFNEIQKFGFDT
eukprot:178660_1